MADRPVFMPGSDKGGGVKEISISFSWSSGFAEVQKKKNVKALHDSAFRLGVYPILEVSSKSDSKLGQRLSAFSLKVETELGPITVESAFQGSKVFEEGGPYRDIYKMDSRSAKKDPRVKSSGKLVGFDLFGDKWPLVPETAFYDWLYLSALRPHQEFLKEKICGYVGFTDIEFNPARSVNCQARTCALLVSFLRKGVLDEALGSKCGFIEMVKKEYSSMSKFLSGQKEIF